MHNIKKIEKDLVSFSIFCILLSPPIVIGGRMDKTTPSPLWEGKTQQDTQVFFQPNGHGIIELINWRFGANEHGNLCVFHDTKPDPSIGLWKFHNVDDDRLRFYPRERR